MSDRGLDYLLTRFSGELLRVKMNNFKIPTAFVIIVNIVVYMTYYIIKKNNNILKGFSTTHTVVQTTLQMFVVSQKTIYKFVCKN